MRFRKKPVEIDAVRFIAPMEPSEQPRWLADALRLGRVRFGEDRTLKIDTLEGQMTAREGDWIIRGVAGEIYPCKPEIFAATYEAAE